MEISTLQSSKKKLIDKENRNNLWTELPKSPWNIELVCRCKHPPIVTSHMPYSWLQIYTRDIFTDVLGKGLKVSIKAQHPIWSHSYFQLVKLATGVQMVGKSPSFRCPLGDWSDHACSVSQACPALCDPMDCSPPGSSVHGIILARILEWVAISSSRGSSRPRNLTCDFGISCIGKWTLYHWAT